MELILPARLVEAKNYWYITYTCTNPITKNVERYRVTFGINYIKKKTERRKTAKVYVNRINALLHKGLNPNMPNIPMYDEIDTPTKKKLEISVIDAVELAYKYQLKRNYSIESNRTLKSIKKIFIKWLNTNKIANMPVNKFTTEKAQMYLDKRFSETSARTANNHKSFLLGFFKYLKKRKYIETNPFEACDTYKTKLTERRGFTEHESKLIIDYMQAFDKELLLFCELIYYCALRPNEIINLQFKNLNVVEKRIEIKGKLIKSGVHLMYVRPLPEFLLQKLLSFNKHNFNEYIFAVGCKPGKKKRKNHHPINDRHNAILKKLKLYEKGLSLYSWKDTAADRLSKIVKNGGLTLREMSEHFGHTMVSTTEIYVKRRSFGDSPNIRKHYPKM